MIDLLLKCKKNQIAYKSTKSSMQLNNIVIQTGDRYILAVIDQTNNHYFKGFSAYSCNFYLKHSEPIRDKCRKILKMVFLILVECHLIHTVLPIHDMMHQVKSTLNGYKGKPLTVYSRA